MTPRLADNPTAPASVPPHRFRWWWVGAVLAATFLLVLAVPRFVNTSATTVARVTVTNNSRYDFDVTVTDASRSGTLDLGTVRSQSSTSFNDVVDQGGTWIFAFASQGHDGGEETVGRAELARDGWRVVIPAAVAQRVAGAGAPPSPTIPSSSTATSP
jgi:hypothetical protein